MLAIHSELSGFEISNSSKVNAFYNKIKKKRSGKLSFLHFEKPFDIKMVSRQ